MEMGRRKKQVICLLIAFFSTLIIVRQFPPTDYYSLIRTELHAVPAPVATEAVQNTCQNATVLLELPPVPDVSQAYAMRRQKSDDVCLHAVAGEVFRMAEHPETHVAYCVTPKVGCTYWLSVLRWLHNDTHGKTYKVPFDIPRYEIHDRPKHMKFYSLSQRVPAPEFLSDRFRFMFVREPYARLWSAYVDKFLLPDLWHVDGWKITRRRKEVSEKARTCGHDVTFPEFVDYITNTSARMLNEHYKPYQYLCSPCVFRPHVIGKMETFQQDASYILQQMNLTQIDDRLQTSDQRAMHEMNMLIDDAFYEVRRRKFFRNCTSSTNVATLLWRVFQINGYLPKNMTFPWAEHATVNRQRLKGLVRNAYQNRLPKNPAFWKAQKQQAMVDAYSELSDSAMERLRTVYAVDFALFGYDPFLEILYRTRQKG